MRLSFSIPYKSYNFSSQNHQLSVTDVDSSFDRGIRNDYKDENGHGEGTLTMPCHLKELRMVIGALYYTAASRYLVLHNVVSRHTSYSTLNAQQTAQIMRPH